MSTSGASSNQIQNEAQEPAPKIIVIKDMKKLECGICKSLLYNASRLHPCGHTYCTGCISAWCDENGSCPECRATISEYSNNREMCGFIDWFLEQNPEDERAEEDKIRLDENEMNSLARKVVLWPSGDGYVRSFPEFMQCTMFSQIIRSNLERNADASRRLLQLTGEKLERLKKKPPTEDRTEFEKCYEYQRKARTRLDEIKGELETLNNNPIPPEDLFQSQAPRNVEPEVDGPSRQPALGPRVRQHSRDSDDEIIRRASV